MKSNLLPSRLKATSEKTFLMIWARDFVPSRVLKISEYFVYCDVFKRKRWDKRSAQIAKGDFLELPKTVGIGIAPIQRHALADCTAGRESHPALKIYELIDRIPRTRPVVKKRQM